MSDADWILPELNADEHMLLVWLGKEEYSQYGECHGSSLDGLVAKKMAQVHHDNGELGSFIAKGVGKMFCSVSLTREGRFVLREFNKRGGLL